MTSLTCAALAAIRIFVSPVGTDGAAGTADAPVKTPQGACEALRQARIRDPQAFAAGGAEIILADGVYVMTSALKLAAQDGGTASAPVVWKAQNRGRAVLSGRTELSSWGPVTDPKALALLADEARGHVRVATIGGTNALPSFLCGGNGVPAELMQIPVSVFCDGQRLPQSRWPNDGYARTGRMVGDLVTPDHCGAICRSGKFEFDSPRLAKWAEEPDLWMYGLWKFEWADQTARVLNIDVAAKCVSVDPRPIRRFGMSAGAQFKARNALSEIDEPGEWALDRANRRLYCWLPREGAEVSLALAVGLVRAVGVTNLRFENLVFECVRETALRFDRCVGCAVTGSTLRHTSSWGVVIWDGSDCRVEGCDLYDLGEGGIKLWGGSFATLKPANHVADNNHIHHHGRVIPNYRPGVHLLGVGNRATHNLIHHTDHQAIEFWGNDHYIGYNVCHDCCQFNDDAGTIYCCQRDWRRRGTVIEHNLVHMTGKQPRARATEAIYLDDFSSGVIVRNNLLNRGSFGVVLCGGQDCEVYGNLVFNCTHGIGLGSRGIETFARPISIKGFESSMFATLNETLNGPDADLYRRRYPKMAKVLEFTDGQAAHNAHWNVITNNVLVGCRGGISKDNWKNVSATCLVTNNFATMEDPGVADYYGLDWSFRPGSEAARRLGDLRFAEMGLYASPLRASPAVKFGEPVTRPRPFGQEYDLAVVRVDLPFLGKLPAGVAECATNVVDCKVPDWSRGLRIEGSFGQADLKDWKSYAMTFTPTATGTYRIVTMGSRGEKTLYDDFKVTGAQLVNGGFEETKGWSVPKEIDKNSNVLHLCNVARPWGVVTAAEAGVPAAEGEKMFCGNDIINASQDLACQAGVPVTLTFKARAAPLD